MKYYLVEIANGDSKIAGKSVYEYATLKEAKANFHSKLGIAMKSDLYESALFLVFNSLGTIYETERCSSNEEVIMEV